MVFIYCIILICHLTIVCELFNLGLTLSCIQGAVGKFTVALRIHWSRVLQRIMFWPWASKGPSADEVVNLCRNTETITSCFILFRLFHLFRPTKVQQEPGVSHCHDAVKEKVCLRWPYCGHPTQSQPAATAPKGKGCMARWRRSDAAEWEERHTVQFLD